MAYTKGIFVAVALCLVAMASAFVPQSGKCRWSARSPFTVFRSWFRFPLLGSLFCEPLDHTSTYYDNGTSPIRARLMVLPWLFKGSQKPLSQGAPQNPQDASGHWKSRRVAKVCAWESTHEPLWPQAKDVSGEIVFDRLDEGLVLSHFRRVQCAFSVLNFISILFPLALLSQPEVSQAV